MHWLIQACACAGTACLIIDMLAACHADSSRVRAGIVSTMVSRSVLENIHLYDHWKIVGNLLISDVLMSFERLYKKPWCDSYER